MSSFTDLIISKGYQIGSSSCSLRVVMNLWIGPSCYMKNACESRVNLPIPNCTVPNIGLIHPKPGFEFLNAFEVAFGMLMKMHVMPLRPLHVTTSTTPVSRQHLDYLCFCAGADLGKGLLNLETSLCTLLAIIFERGFLSTVYQRRTCFLIFMTLNRSKSFSPRLFWMAARFFAHELSSNFCWTLCSSHFFATWPTPLARGSLGMTMGVRESFASAISWRGTGAFSEGPSRST